MAKRRNYITDFGGDGQTIVLLHGFLTASKYWARLQPKLTKAGYHVVAIDLLGFGAAPKPTDIEYSYDDHLRHIDTAIASLQITEPFVLIGHSMGALLAAQYNSRHGDKVDSLILLHPPLYLNAGQAKRAIRERLFVYRWLLDSRYRRIIWEVVRFSRVSIIGYHSHDAREKSLRNIIERATIFDELERVNKKTLLLLGLRDRALYRDNLHRHGALASSVEIKTENVDHNSPWKRPSLVYEYIVRFIA